MVVETIVLALLTAAFIVVGILLREVGIGIVLLILIAIVGAIYIISKEKKNENSNPVNGGGR